MWMVMCCVSAISLSRLSDWIAFYGYVGKEGWDEAYESVVNEEREIFPPEDGRCQTHVCVCVCRILIVGIRSSLADIPELHPYHQY
jgi:hypothetical protein